MFATERFVKLSNTRLAETHMSTEGPKLQNFSPVMV